MGVILMAVRKRLAHEEKSKKGGDRRKPAR
jgi:hypothetical protein